MRLFPCCAVRLAFALSLSSVVAGTSVAQSLVGNTGPRRPLTVEDATPLPRQQLEFYLSSISFTGGDGPSIWSAVPGLAYGLAPRTQVDVRLPLVYPREGGERGVAGGELSVIYALNVETQSLPALALRGGVFAPVGGASTANGHEWLRGIVTKRMFGGRGHINYQYTFGDEASVPPAPVDLARWSTGLSFDRLFPVKGILVSAEAVARQPIVDSVDPYWTAGAGARYQLTGRTVVEASISRALDGSNAWSASAGLGWSRVVAGLLPGLGRWGR